MGRSAPSRLLPARLTKGVSPIDRRKAKLSSGELHPAHRGGWSVPARGPRTARGVKRPRREPRGARVAARVCAPLARSWVRARRECEVIL
eukprot:4842907-Prymnesium_polylepis.2